MAAAPYLYYYFDCLIASLRNRLKRLRAHGGLERNGGASPLQHTRTIEHHMMNTMNVRARTLIDSCALLRGACWSARPSPRGQKRVQRTSAMNEAATTGLKRQKGREELCEPSTGGTQECVSGGRWAAV